MEYTITPLTPHTGAEVRGIDLNEGAVYRVYSIGLSPPFRLAFSETYGRRRPPAPRR